MARRQVNAPRAGRIRRTEIWLGRVGDHLDHKGYGANHETWGGAALETGT
jgi:hypothetical protein